MKLHLLLLLLSQLGMAQVIHISGKVYFSRPGQNGSTMIYHFNNGNKHFLTKSDPSSQFSFAISTDTDSLQFVFEEDSTMTFPTYFYGNFQEEQSFSLNLEVPFHTRHKSVLYGKGEEGMVDYEEIHFKNDKEHCKMPRKALTKNHSHYFTPIHNNGLWQRNWYQLRAKQQDDEWEHCTWFQINNGLNFVSTKPEVERLPPFETTEVPEFIVQKDKEVIYFEQSSYELGNKAKEKLKQIAQRKNFSEINLIGYTDQEGEKRANDALGYFRAKAVQSFLENNGLEEIPIQILEKEKVTGQVTQKELERRVEIFFKHTTNPEIKIPSYIHIQNTPSATELILESEANSSIIMNQIALQTGTVVLEASHTFRLVLRKKKKPGEFEYYTIWLHPGEELFITNSESEVFFNSSDSSISRKNELNFFKAFSAFDSNFEGIFSYLPVYNNEGKDFLSVLKEIEGHRIEFATTYFSRNPVSKSFEEQVFHAFRLKTISNLLRYKWQFKSSKKVDSTAAVAVINSLQENTELENFIYYSEALYLKTKLKYLDRLSEEAGFQHLISNFSDPLRENLLFQFISSAYNSPYITAYCKEYFKMYPNTDLSDFLHSKYEDYLEENEEGDLTYGNSNTLFNLATQEHVTWEEILKDGKWKVIDFWATWCGGCRSDFPISKEVYGSLNLPVYYVALDHNKAAWAKISEKESLPKENSFYLEDYRNSTMYKKYGLNTIPRYFLVDGEGNVVEDNLMRPRVPELVQQIKSYMK